MKEIDIRKIHRRKWDGQIAVYVRLSYCIHPGPFQRFLPFNQGSSDALLLALLTLLKPYFLFVLCVHFLFQNVTALFKFRIKFVSYLQYIKNVENKNKQP